MKGLLLSGGMDSIALAWWLRPEQAITVDYGQLAAIAETRTSRQVCEELGIGHTVIDARSPELGSGDMVGDVLFPVVPVDQRGGKIITFGKEDFRLYATGRAPGSNTRRVQFGHSGGPFALAQHSLEGVVPFEIMQDANAVPGIDMA